MKISKKSKTPPKIEITLKSNERKSIGSKLHAWMEHMILKSYTLEKDKFFQASNKIKYSEQAK